jgi:hypothetical protein
MFRGMDYGDAGKDGTLFHQTPVLESTDKFCTGYNDVYFVGPVKSHIPQQPYQKTI